MRETLMIKGSCCCEAIRFELLSMPTMMGTCHCSRCRKVGASTFVFVSKASLRWVQGKEFVSRYEPEAPYLYARCFCRKCGTALGEIDSAQETFPIAANCLDDDPGIRNLFHEFVAEKPDWYEICDGAKQFEAHPVKS
jgi:hypothetical protein